MPRRDKKTGPKPSVTGNETLGPHRDRDDHRWQFPAVTEYTDKEKKMLLAKGLEIAVTVMYTTHIYSFGGKLYHQVSGGPTGLRGTGSCCRVTLNRFDVRSTHGSPFPEFLLI